MLSPDRLKETIIPPTISGEFYTKSIEESPYTKDMREIDKDYLKIFLCREGRTKGYHRIQVWNNNKTDVKWHVRGIGSWLCKYTRI